MKSQLSKWSLVLFLLLGLVPAAATAQVSVGIGIGVAVHTPPPMLPVYVQPPIPGEGYMWTPGYWAWGEAGYYWVPGVWVRPPMVGVLWTPGYWGFAGGVYGWHAGYWGPHIGFYGGVNYGFGYGGVGFVGGEWRGGAFFYNRSVTNVSVTNVTNVYNRTVVINENHVAFNGGEGGIAARPTSQEEAAEREPHTAPLAEQTQHEQAASQNRQNFASENHGRPAIAATARPGDFSNRSAVPARTAGADYREPAMSPKEARGLSTPAASRGNSNDGFRPFTPPAKNASSSGESRAESTPRPAPAARQNTPKSNPYKSSPTPKKQSAPKPPKDHGKGR
jgi:hypothetical protein